MAMLPMLSTMTLSQTAWLLVEVLNWPYEITLQYQLCQIQKCCNGVTSTGTGFHSYG